MANYSLQEKIYQTRMAGRIRRLHIRPMNGEEQNVAAHTWGLTMILLDLFPDISKEGLVFALRHDVAEVVTGDIPANVKWANPGLEEALEKREQEFLAKMGWKAKHTGVPSWERENLYIKIADRIELLFYCLEQIHMGNSMLVDVYQNVEDKILEDAEKLDVEVYMKVLTYINAYIEYLAEVFSKKVNPLRDGLSVAKDSIISSE